MRVINLLQKPTIDRKYLDNLMWEVYNIKYTDPPQSEHDWVMDEEYCWEFEVYIAECSICGFEIVKDRKGWSPNTYSVKKFGAEYVFSRTCKDVIDSGNMHEALS